MALHGFNSATKVYELAQEIRADKRTHSFLYVGDYDPSGLFMSEKDLPARISEYGGDHVVLKRTALTREQVAELPSFPVTNKRKDPRYRWFVRNHGARCFEIDALDPNVLRHCVENAIRKYIEPVAWSRCELVNSAELESLRKVLGRWGKAR